MANLNGKGPNNEGPLTGRGLGNCKDGTDRVVEGIGRGLGRVYGRGLGRGMRQRVAGRGGRGFFRNGNGPNNNRS